MIDEKYLKVLEQYDLVCYDMYRARGAHIIETEKGIKLLKQAAGSESRYCFEAAVTNGLKHITDIPVDTFIKNRDDNIITKSDEERYILKDWYPGEECNLKQSREIEKAINNLARLHCALKKLPKIDQEGVRVRIQESIADSFAKRHREMRRVKSYLRDKKQKNEFEIMYINMCNSFLEQAAIAEETLKHIEPEGENAGQNVPDDICHGSYTHHNLIRISGPQNIPCSINYAIVGFECAAYGKQITDLYGFMRKTLEKNSWDIELGHKMLDIYNKEKNISNYELQLLKLLFMFPEKFWKITNCYYNKKKAWVPAKNLQKLQAVKAQLQGRINFIQSIG